MHGCISQTAVLSSQLLLDKQSPAMALDLDKDIKERVDAFATALAFVTDYAKPIEWMGLADDGKLLVKNVLGESTELRGREGGILMLFVIKEWRQVPEQVLAQINTWLEQAERVGFWDSNEKRKDVANFIYTHYCSHCRGIMAMKLKVCWGCKHWAPDRTFWVRYCSLRCQAADWRRLHKDVCPMVTAACALEEERQRRRSERRMAFLMMWAEAEGTPHGNSSSSSSGGGAAPVEWVWTTPSTGVPKTGVPKEQVETVVSNEVDLELLHESEQLLEALTGVPKEPVETVVSNSEHLHFIIGNSSSSVSNEVDLELLHESEQLLEALTALTGVPK